MLFLIPIQVKVCPEWGGVNSHWDSYDLSQYKVCKLEMTLFDQMGDELFDLVSTETVVAMTFLSPVGIVVKNCKKFSTFFVFEFSTIESEVNGIMKHTNQIVMW